MKTGAYLIFLFLCFLGILGVVIQLVSFPVVAMEGIIKRKLLRVRTRIIPTTSVFLSSIVVWVSVVYLWRWIVGERMPILAIALGILIDYLSLKRKAKNLNREALLFGDVELVGSIFFIILWLIFCSRPLIWI